MSMLPRALVPNEEARELGRMLALYGLLGVVAGLVAVVFTLMVDFAGHWLLMWSGINPVAHGADAEAAGLSLPEGIRWWALVIPALGGLASGGILTWLAPEGMGTGTGGVIDAYHRRGGLVRKRVPFVKSVASALTIGSGGSAGVEGPIGNISAGMGSIIGQVFRLSATERRILLMAGFAAGIGAIFHAPMATSIFATEVLYRRLDMEHEVLIPSIVSSTIAYGTYGVIHGWEPLWHLPTLEFGGAEQLVAYLVLAITVAVWGHVFILIHHACDRWIGENERLPIWLRPALGGLGIGAIALFVPQAAGVGYGMAQTAINGDVAVWTLLVLSFAKIVTSSLTAGAGGSGGLFAPSLVIGSTLGGAIGLAAEQLVPALSVSHAEFAVVGMAGFFGTVINAPLSTVIMVSELAGNYHLLVPTLWVCAIAWFANRSPPLYYEQASSRLEAPGHLAEMAGAVLRGITVRQAMEPDKPEPVTVHPETPLRELVHLFAQTAQGVFPIVDSNDGRLLGVVDGRELRRTVGEVGVDEVLIARDFQGPALTARPNDSLYDVVNRMTASGYNEIIVVDASDPTRLVGILSRREVVNSYHRRMLATAPEGAATTRRADTETASGAGAGGGTEASVNVVTALDRGGILYGIRADTYEEALTQLAHQADLPEACDREQLREMLVERERLGSTCIGDRIALPHPQTNQLTGITEPRIVIGLLRRPIPWGEPETGGDEPPLVDIVCMLLAPSGDTHLELLGSLARSLNDATLQQLLRQRAAKKEVLQRLETLRSEEAAREQAV